MKKYVVFTLCFFLLIAAYPAKVFTQFQHYGIERGLSNSQVNSITEDDRGYIWIGTRTGLNRFDGSKFVTYHYNIEDKNSIPSEDVSEVLFSKSGYLVVGTWDSGIGLFDPITSKTRRLEDTNGLEINTIKRLYEDKDTLLWIGTFGRGVYTYNYKTDTFKQCLHASPKNKGYFLFSEGICEVRDTIYIISKEDGLGFIPKSTGQIEFVKDDQGNRAIERNVSAVTSSGSKVYMGTYDGQMLIYDVNTKKIEVDTVVAQSAELNGFNITDITIDARGDIWLSTAGGLAFYDIDKKSVTFKGQRSTRSFTTFEDSRGIFWIGTWGNGLEKYDPSTMIFNSVELSEFESSRVSSILEYQDSVFFFGTDRGLVECNLKTGETNNIILNGPKGKFVNENIVKSMVMYQGKVILVSQSGFYEIDPNSLYCDEHQVSQLPEFENAFFREVHSDNASGIWLSTWSKGIVFVHRDGSHDHLEYKEGDSLSELNTSLVSALYQSTSGDYWIGSKTGLNLLDHVTNSFKLVDFSATELTPNRFTVNSIVEDSVGALWLGTSNGLIKYDFLNDQVERYTSLDGLPSNTILNVVGVGNDLWLTSDKGLARFSLVDKHIEIFTVSDGLMTNELIFNSVAKSSSGLLFIGSNAGVNFFDPSTLSSYSHSSKVYLNDFYIDNNLVEVEDGGVLSKHISYLKTVELDYDQNNLMFDFSSVNFSHTHNELFAHKLEGFDKDWVVHKFNDRRIKYTNLDPGRYLLRIKILHANGKESPETELKLTIKKPYWGQWWFLFVVILGGVSFVVLIIYWRTRVVLKQKMRLEYKVNLRTKEVAEQKAQIEEMNSELLSSYSQLKSNVQYAKEIQQALLPSDAALLHDFDKHFIMYQPKGIVSGDFYWITEVGPKVVLATVDCTGHGVSGAFMTILTNGILRDIVDHKHITEPNDILHQLQLDVNKILNQQNTGNSDGMDISVLTYDKTKKKLKIASAITSVLVVKGDEKIIVEGDRIHIGGAMVKEGANFINHEFKVDQPVSVYMYSDGFYDQFGGERDTKYKKRNFYDFLYKNRDKSMFVQQSLLEKEFLDWKGDFPQVDDVLVMGVKFDA